MTWVIGFPGMFGYAVGISDVRITLSDGTEKDCLQKIHRVGRNLALGFAGSVNIGLGMAAEMGAVLDGQDSKALWNPLQVAEKFPEFMRWVFHSFPLEERELCCHLMLLSAHPTDRHGDAPWARCYVHRFFSPDFYPVVANPGEFVSIGSGADKERYSQALRKLQSDTEVPMFETMMPGGSSLAYMDYLTSRIEQNPQPGISPHLHLCIVGRSGILFGKNDRVVPDRPENSFTMPAVARNLPELQGLIANKEASVELAIC